MKVLVVDDDAQSARALAALIESDGHQALTARSGEAALEAAMRHAPEAVLLDIDLGTWSGWQVAKAFKSSDSLRATHLIAHTARTGDEDIERAIECGFSMHVTKPARRGEILAALAVLGMTQRVTNRPEQTCITC